MDRLTVVGIAAVGAGALVVYAVFRALSGTAVEAIKQEAKAEATNDLLTGAEKVAAAVNETLAVAGDPGNGGVDAALAGGTL